MNCSPFVLPLLVLFSTSFALAQEEQATEPTPYAPEVAKSSEEGREAMAKFGLPNGFESELVAAEPFMANPVCFYPANDGSFYVCETFRLHAGVTDMRQHVANLEDDMACFSVEDRVAMFKRWAGDEFIEQYATEHERIKLMRDTDGDGVVDWSTVYADGFNDPADGIAAGVLEYNGDVYYTCIPHLWKLRDTDGDGQADERTSLSNGYGVRVTLLGHDLHGMCIGPDGWLYFSCGDRGFNVETPDGRIMHPDTGAVLRCRLDGSDLEVFHTGLRNPQELAFDEFGNLFTGDNNSDGGDQARWVQIVEGADSGWRSSYQWIFDPVARGPWNAEKLWNPHFDGQAAYILPPIANIAAGPSGLAYYPGTGLTSEYEGSFFLCDFRGAVSSSGVHSFKLEPKGASFELVERSEFIWQTLVTDVAFGPDGCIYFSDWVQGWNPTGKGRLYRAFQTETRNSPGTRVVANVLAEGMGEKSLDELAVLLKHKDMRLGQMAQFELVARGRDGWSQLQQILKGAEHELASLRAAWGLSMAADLDSELLEYLHPFLRDPNPRLRAQIARVLGDHRYSPAAPRLIEALSDEDPTVRKFAAIGCARLKEARAVEALFALVSEVADEDTVLRHAGTFALANCASIEQLLAAKENESVHVRLAAVVALRRKEAAEVGEFLNDASALVVLEAARAINDVPIATAFPALAGLIDDLQTDDEALLRRVLNANLRTGGDQACSALTDFALNPERPERLRADAISMLANWSEPESRDYVISNWRPLEPRTAGIVAQEAERISLVLNELPDSLVQQWIGLTRSVPFEGSDQALVALVHQITRDGETRAAALELLEELKSALFEPALRAALADGNSELRAFALEALPRIDFSEALPLFQSVLKSGGIDERRAVYHALSLVPDDQARELLMKEFNKIQRRALPAELQLDLIEAMAERDSNATREAVTKLRRSQIAQSPILGKWRATYFGGDAQKGKKIFTDNATLSCVRCHLSGDQSKTGVGPDLAGIGKRLSRDQLVQSVVAPNARIAPGFEAVLLVLEDGELVAGRIVDEGPEWLSILGSDGEAQDIEVSTIAERRPDLSAMPDGMGDILTRFEMRDLVEYLSTL
ncbi:MAG: quinoprotein glucose dehydrogenase [Planctomycetota bacterium]|jgi:quinoprotein glucose dehydrogenase